MNTSLNKIVETTEDEKVLANAAKLISLGTNHKVRVEFVKKDKSLRTMICSLRDNWNSMNGLETTKSGLEMLKTKISNGMATVTEWLSNGSFQPRTLNLKTIVKMEAV